MDAEQRTDLDRGEGGLRHIDAELHRAIRQHRDHRRGRPCGIARIADDIVDAAGRGRRQHALRQAPHSLPQFRLRLLDLVLGRLDGLDARRQAADGEIGFRLADLRVGGFQRSRGGVVVGLCAGAALVEVAGAVIFALGVRGLRFRHVHLRLEHRDLFRTLAHPQVGKLRLSLRKRRLGLRHGNFCVGAFQRHHWRTRPDAVTALDRDRFDLRHLDRREQHVLALDIADGQRCGRRAGAEQLRRERQRTEKTHGLASLPVAGSRAASITLRLSAATATTLAASLSPISRQPILRITASRPMRK